MNKKVFKKTLTLILAFIMLFSIAACSSSDANPSSGDANPSSGDANPNSGDANNSSDDGKVYTLRYASNDGTTTERHTLFLEVIKKELEERSNGRLILEIYPSGTLAKPGEVIEGLKNGTVDIGLDNATFYTGMYLYTDLLCAAGFNLGNTERLQGIMREYSEAYTASEFSEVVLLCQGTTGTFGVYSNREIKTMEDFAGLQCRVTANYIPFFEKLGISGIMMPSSEVYEGIRLGVIDSTVSNTSFAAAFNMQEVTNFYTSLPMTFGEMVVVMSVQTYNSLPADLQAVIDDWKDSINDAWLNYLLTSEANAKDYVAKGNPDFKWIELPVEEQHKISELAKPILEEKAAAMDAAGLDGSGALAWLLDHSV